MGAPKGKRTGTPRKAMAVRLNPATIAWLERRAKAAGLPVSTMAARVIERVYQNHIEVGAEDA